MPEAPLPRSLADELRVRSDGDLVALLRSRPDLTAPVPSDVGQLAVRATTRASVARALDRLDRAALGIVEGLVLLDEPTTVKAIGSLMPFEPDTTASLVNRLRSLALVWGTDDELRLVRVVRDVLGPQVAGLGPPVRALLNALPGDRLGSLAADLGLPPSREHAAMVARVADRLTDPAYLDSAVAAVGAESESLVRRLAHGPPSGRVENALRPVTLAKSRTPVDRLLARGLVIPTDSGTVVLPREAGLHLRGGQLHVGGLDRPDPELAAHDVTLVDRLGAGTAAELVRSVEMVAEAWADDPPGVLRAGGLGVRELRRTAALLDGDVGAAVRAIEVAFVAGLVAADSTGSHWLPTTSFDTWLRSEPASRWVALASAWLGGSRVPTLAVPRDDREKPPAALSDELDRPGAPELRGLALGLLGSLPPGSSMDVDDVLSVVAWHRPRRSGPARDALVRWSLDEAHAYGLLARGAVTSAARLLFAGDLAAAEEAMAALLPLPLDHVLLQADLTAIAPGPLEPPLAREMALLATVESTGGATVYRFTEASVRRALEAGRTSADITSFLTSVSRTPVPQPLTYLVDDVARRYGLVRVAAAPALITCEDPALLDQIVGEPRVMALSARRLAPTVASVAASPSVVLELLQSLGMHPSADALDPSGGARARHRAPARGKPRPVRADRPA
ncbi:MAG: helicase-associated domain-containing protein, partial [Jiangellales bacterium]